MKLDGFLRKPQKAHALCNEVTTGLMNRIYNILEGLTGRGCYVDKPLDQDGRGWKIVVNGRESDTEPMSLPPMPFDLVWCDDCWRVWVYKAQVCMNNFTCQRDPQLSVIESADSAVTVRSFKTNDSVYLIVYSQGEHKNGNDAYYWTLGTSTPTDSPGKPILASVLLGSVTGAFSASQMTRGNQNLYTLVNSEILTVDGTKGTYSLVTTTSNYAEALACDEYHHLVIRHNGRIEYVPLDNIGYSIAEAAEEWFDMLPDDGENNEIYDEDELWERLKEIAQPWPAYQPIFSPVYIWNKNREGWDQAQNLTGNEPLLGLPDGSWTVLTKDLGEIGDIDLVLNSEGDEVDGFLDTIEDEYKWIAEDPDDETYKDPPGWNGDEVSRYDEFIEKLLAFSTAVGSWKTYLGSVESVLATINQGVDTLNAKLQSISDDLQEIETVDQGLDSQITSLE